MVALESDVDRRACSVEGPLGDRRRRLEAPSTELVVDRRSVRERTDPVEQAWHLEDVGHHIVCSWVTDLIVGPRTLEEVDQAGVVDRGDRVDPPLGGLDHREPVVAGERVTDGVRPTRMLERRLQPGRLDLGQRRVVAMTVRGDDPHVQSTPARRSASVRNGSTTTAASAISMAVCELDR